MGLRSTLALAASAELSSAQDLTTARAQISFNRSVLLATGTAAGKADRLFSDRRTLAASATEDLDLSGSLLDALGGAATFARVKGLFISAASTNTNNVIVGAGTNPWITALNSTGTVTLRPGASIGLFSGDTDATAYAVTAGTGDVLKIANSGSGTSVTYEVVIIGSSA